jgi:hypothetical protein
MDETSSISIVYGSEQTWPFFPYKESLGARFPNGAPSS